MTEPSQAVRADAQVAANRGELAITPPPLVEIELRPSSIPAEFASRSPEPAPARSLWSRWGLFLVTVALPVAAASLYLFLVAAPRYVSSASFIVRETSIGREEALTALMQKAGMSVALDETHAVMAYLTSRDLVERLASEDDLRAILSRPRGDFLFRYPQFWQRDNSEHLYRRFLRMADVELDAGTQIVTIEVNAFTADDAQHIASAMVRHAEALVNQLNERAYQDAATGADNEFNETQARLNAAEDELQRFRTSSGSVDPSADSTAKLGVITGLSTDLARMTAQIAQQTALTPTSPSLAPLREQIQAYREEIEKRKLEIAGSSTSSATRLDGYERLTLLRDLAAKSLTAAARNRDDARQEARRQHLYLQLIAQPNLSRDFARYPNVVFDVSALLAICLMAFFTLRKLGDVAREHRA